ncbi:unnamed protein product [Allacma fusca]|uniref:Uncharacterized protein n=1 Tax=Allacma fusca TaxID=39272 RepID=A0A8J2K5E8_9HEXA|nr:unnamed protein product [Allacma fusca]
MNTSSVYSSPFAVFNFTTRINFRSFASDLRIYLGNTSQMPKLWSVATAASIHPSIASKCTASATAVSAIG